MFILYSFNFTIINLILFYFTLNRVVWIIAIGLSLCLCGILIWNVLIKWNQTPVIVSFAEKSAPVWEVPFPAVTVCPETKSYANKLNFTDAYNMLIEGMKVNMSDET